ncbi:MAG: hypothetical protein ACXQS4_05145 [Methermicoccaceae archaeon]
MRLPVFDLVADERLHEALGEVEVEYTPIKRSAEEVATYITTYMARTWSEDIKFAVSHFTHCLESSGVAWIGNALAINCEGCAMATSQNEEVEKITHYLTSDGVRVVVRTHHCGGLVCAGVCDTFQQFIEEDEMR